MAFEQLGHGRIPVRAEHHVLHDQLPLACEQLGQRYLALGPLEYVLLVDVDHRQPPPLRVDLVMVAGESLLLVEQLDPGR